MAFTIENDTFVGSDNNYTNGLGFTFRTGQLGLYPEGSFERDWLDTWSFLPQVGNESCLTYAAWTIGQEIYTPDDISIDPPNPLDRSYAGILFLDTSLYARAIDVTHAWNLRLGLVGPSALAGQLQDWFHGVIDAEDPKGWDTQLPDEFILNLDYTVGYQLAAHEMSDSLSVRLVPMAGVSVGNYFTGVAGAVYGEFGWHLPPSVGLLSVRRGLDPFVDVDSENTHPWSLSLYVGAGGFGVGHFLPLDGTVFRRSQSVESESTVGFFSTGLTWRVGGWSLNYLSTAFENAFDTQIQGTEYGTLSISWTL